MAQYQTAVDNLFINQPVTSKSGNYTATLQDVVIEYTSTAASYTVTIPASSLATTVGKMYLIKDVSGGAGTNNIVIAPASGTIDGNASVSITSNYGAVSIYSDGSNWFSSSTNIGTFAQVGAIGFWNRFNPTPFLPGTTVIDTTTTNWSTTPATSGSRLDFSALTNLQSRNLTVGQYIQTFTQTGVYRIQATASPAGSGTATCIAQIVKNNTTVIAAGNSGVIVANENIPFSAGGTFTFNASDFIDFRFIGLSTTYNFYQIEASIQQLPSTTVTTPGANTPTQNIRLFTSSGTYAPSGNLQYALVEVIGSGGAGGGPSTSASLGSVAAGGGGGAGGYVRATLTPSQIGSGATVTIGAAGTGGAGALGGAGATCSFSTLLFASGGRGGTASINSSASIAAASGGAGGVGSVSSTSIQAIIATGGAGSFGFAGTVGGFFSAGGGAGGTTILGGGGAGVGSTNSAGNVGTSYGSGGSGGAVAIPSTSVAGGNGVAGAVIVTEYIFAPPPILSTSSAIVWSTVTGTASQMAQGNGYITANGATVTLTLPTAITTGTQMQVQGSGTGSWLIAQNTGQQIIFGSMTTTSGTVGSLASTYPTDGVTLLAQSSSSFIVTEAFGNIAIV